MRFVHAGMPAAVAARIDRLFLRAPIRLADRVFGNLYLTEKRSGGEFIADDPDSDRPGPFGRTLIRQRDRHHMRNPSSVAAGHMVVHRRNAYPSTSWAGYVQGCHQARFQRRRNAD